MLWGADIEECDDVDDEDDDDDEDEDDVNGDEIGILGGNGDVRAPMLDVILWGMWPLITGTRNGGRRRGAGEECEPNMSPLIVDANINTNGVVQPNKKKTKVSIQSANCFKQKKK